MRTLMPDESDFPIIILPPRKRKQLDMLKEDDAKHSSGVKRNKDGNEKIGKNMFRIQYQYSIAQLAGEISRMLHLQNSDLLQYFQKKKQKQQNLFDKNSYKKGEKINTKVIKKQKVLERKRLKQQKMSFVNSIFNSCVIKSAK